MEYAAPNDNSNAHSVSLNTPTVSNMPLEDSANIQNASRKMAGVRISADLMWGRYFFIDLVMGIVDKFPATN